MWTTDLESVFCVADELTSLFETVPKHLEMIDGIK